MRPSDPPLPSALPSPWRVSTQALLPAIRPAAPLGRYDLYPAFPLVGGVVEIGFEALARVMAGRPVVLLDGEPGVFWEHFRERLDEALRRMDLRPRWISTAAAMHDAHRIESRIAPSLGGDDPLFGRRFDGALTDFIDVEALDASAAPVTGEVVIVYGCGAALARREALVVYLELPKNEAQYRARAGAAANLGMAEALEARAAYKRSYFVDWPVLRRHKGAILERIDWIVDAQRPEEPALMSGRAFRAALGAMCRTVLRARPWFEPGPWGGQWLKRHVPQAQPDVPNYGWSFELIAPENGLLFESAGRLLEVSFDWLMLAHHREVLGVSAEVFGQEFPIRFDYLDTVEGGNLSLQCHPRLDYIRANFGERITQDETYYILDCAPGAEVYLGFHESIDPKAFRKELEASAATGVAVDVRRHVNTLPARRGDLFLIPAGTIHCSGRGNLVLEISATPYIFTFKMYDWLRMDLDGRPRTLNIDRAFENLDITRRASVVRDHLISRPRTMARGADWSLIHLPTHPAHFYDVERFEFSTMVEGETAGSVRVMNVVEGGPVLVETADGARRRFHFAETFVIPAAAERFRLVNEGPGVAKVVSARVKRDLSMLREGEVT